MPLTPPADNLIEPVVRTALAEDLGAAGDITTDAIIPKDRQWQGAFVARQPGIVAGIDCARITFRLMDPSITLEVRKPDGAAVGPKDVIATLKGPARAVLTGERVALNFLCHLSGIATATHRLVEAVKPHKARIRCTRKTTPGLRVLEKYAVLAGGGVNHRTGLYDAVLIKDNHIAAAGGLREAVLKARKAVGDSIKVELEVDTLDQLKQALDLPINGVLLDNMEPALLRQAVEMVKGRFTTEASGGVTLANVAAIAASGVDFIAVGWITHSSPVLDVGLDEIIK